MGRRAVRRRLRADGPGAHPGVGGRPLPEPRPRSHLHRRRLRRLLGRVEPQPADPHRAAVRRAGGGRVLVPDAPWLHPTGARQAGLRQLDADRHCRNLHRGVRCGDPDLQSRVQGGPGGHPRLHHPVGCADHLSGTAGDRGVARAVCSRVPLPHLHAAGHGHPRGVAADGGREPHVDSGGADVRNGHRHQRRAGGAGRDPSLAVLFPESQLRLQPDDPGADRHHLRRPRQHPRRAGGRLRARHLRVGRRGVLRGGVGAAGRLCPDHPHADPPAQRPVRHRRGAAAVSSVTTVATTRPALDETAAPWRRVPLYAIGGTVVLGIVLPLVLVRLDIGTYLITLLILFFIQAVVAQSWNLIMGYGGIYSFAQVALFAVGGWTSGILVHSLGWNPFVAVLFAPVVAAIAALGIGLPTLRLRGVYVVLLTLAFHELARVFTVTGPRFISGGGYGLVTVQTFSFGDVIGDQRTIYLYYLAGFMFAIATFVIWRVIHSPLGVAVMALRDSETYGVSGGWGTFGGPILGAGIVIGLDQYLVALGDYRELLLGLIIAGIAVFAPQGLWPVVRRLYDKYLAPEGAPVHVEVSPTAPHGVEK